MGSFAGCYFYYLRDAFDLRARELFKGSLTVGANDCRPASCSKSPSWLDVEKKFKGTSVFLVGPVGNFLKVSPVKIGLSNILRGDFLSPFPIELNEAELFVKNVFSSPSFVDDRNDSLLSLVGPLKVKIRSR